MPLTKTRFAPSPTGLMHIGNARTALLSALYGQRFLLRIEDTDAERSRPEFVAALLEDLRWLGLSWDEGPRSEEPDPAWFQSQRGAIYQRYYAQLEQEGLAYPCFCSPQELEISRRQQLRAGQPPRYSGKCAQLSAEEAQRRRAQGLRPTLRFRVPKGALVRFEDGIRGPQSFATDAIGDFVIRRADGSAAFFFCNAVDDALMGVTHVLRGDDHLANTPRQILVLEALGLPVPQYVHLALILGDDGAPLSKRNGSRSIKQLREQGYFPIAVLNLLARLGHHYDSEALMDLATLKARFDRSRLGKSPARFDPAHLDHWQQLALKSAEDPVLWDWLHAETRAIVPERRLGAFLAIVRSNCLFPDQAHEWARALFTDELKVDSSAAEVARQAGERFFLAALDAAQLAGEDFDAFLAALQTRTGTKGKSLFLPLRAALTGRCDGPELGAVYRLLDPHRRHRRLAEFTYASE
ncbi:glutamate--tRNA ligase [Candidatus Methylocalor cossyra]|uniref:Glutamate--tRNA ligase n=1 Tax=Candidatus Methylocalor cossyra TaxID=3108543 RepID=A0ABM9NH92_9GAMM